MRFLDLTLDTPAGNVALDEALLDAAEQLAGPGEVLRLWEPSRPMVVIGRASQAEVEVRCDVCTKQDVPVLRRCSGGAAIVTGPGCLMYAVVLSLEHRPHLRSIDYAHEFILGRLVAALETSAPGVQRCGTSDLAIDGRKFSGNSMRVSRSHLLYHGTLLYQFPLELIADCLKTPPRQPEYREGRDHLEFVTNLKVTPDQLRTALRAGWSAVEPLTDWPRAPTERLVADKYSRSSWNFRR
jgi:lipoate-protein ligase A